MESICRDVFCARKRKGKEGGRIADANSVEVAASVHCITWGIIWQTSLF